MREFKEGRWVTDREGGDVRGFLVFSSNIFSTEIVFMMHVKLGGFDIASFGRDGGRTVEGERVFMCDLAFTIVIHDKTMAQKKKKIFSHFRNLEKMEFQFLFDLRILHLNFEICRKSLFFFFAYFHPLEFPFFLFPKNILENGDIFSLQSYILIFSFKCILGWIWIKKKRGGYTFAVACIDL